MRFINTLSCIFLVVSCGKEDPQPTYYPPPVQTCPVAEEGQQRCTGSNVFVCENQRWILDQRCEGGQTCQALGTAAYCIGGCTNGEQECDGNSVQTCIDGEWSGMSCAADVCVETSLSSAECQSAITCTGELTYRCLDDVLQECSIDTWITFEDCTFYDEMCITTSPNESFCAECVTGDQMCIGTVLETCVGNIWNTTTDCAPGTCVQIGDTASCEMPGCTNGYQQCVGTTLQTCSGGDWVTTQNCSPNACIESGNTAYCDTPACTNGYQRCSGTTLETCSGGEWVFTQNCSPGTCVPSGSTASCQTTSELCTNPTGGQYWVCDGNQTFECNGTTEVGAVINCAAWDIGVIVNGWCWDFGGTWGADCIMPAGAPCVLSDGTNQFVQPCGTAAGPSPNMGCDWVDGCVSTSGACTAPFNAVCESTRLTFNCHPEFNQRLSFNCGSPDIGGGYCDVGTTACIEPAGGMCADPGDPNRLPINCEVGTTCQVVEGSGTCQPI